GRELAEGRVLAEEARLLGRALEHREEAWRVDGLLEELEGAFPHRLDDGRGAREGAHDDELGRARGLLQGLDELEAAPVAQVDVEERHVERLPGEELPAARERRRRLDAVALLLERPHEHLAERRVVLDDEDLREPAL